MERARGDHSRPSGMCDAHQGGRGAVVERLTLDLRSCGVVATGSWRCTPAKGPCTWTVTATDLAGNVQARTYVKKLVVR
ncbi:MAG: hypothetical protein QM323_05915 [Acidobacteriota bacterium]|nr:hypothetical protein [Acidobacteriota bacterium]